MKPVADEDFVLDASVTMAWCFEDEADAYADSVLQRLQKDRAIVPVLWTLEVSNVLLMAERKGRLQEADSTYFLAILSQLPITIEALSDFSLSRASLHLGRTYHLSAYDAAYLDLANRHGLKLATRDGRLQEAAKRCGVGLITSS